MNAESDAQEFAERVADAWFKYEFEHGNCSGFDIREKLGGLIASELRAGGWHRGDPEGVDMAGATFT